MEGLLKGIGDALLALGLPGIIIIGLGLACVRLFNLYTEVQEKRLIEAKESNAALSQATNALNTLTQVITGRMSERGNSNIPGPIN